MYAPSSHCTGIGRAKGRFHCYSVMYFKPMHMHPLYSVYGTEASITHFKWGSYAGIRGPNGFDINFLCRYFSNYVMKNSRPQIIIVMIAEYTEKKVLLVNFKSCSQDGAFIINEKSQIPTLLELGGSRK